MEKTRSNGRDSTQHATTVCISPIASEPVFGIIFEFCNKLPMKSNMNISKQFELKSHEIN